MSWPTIWLDLVHCRKSRRISRCSCVCVCVCNTLRGSCTLYVQPETLTPDHLTQPASNGKRQYQATRFAFRARWFDDHIVHAITSTSSSPDPSSPLPIRQVVLLGAGMDSRAWRLPHLKNTTWFELDRPGVLQAKLSMLQRVGAQGGSVYNEQGLVMEGSDGNAQSWRYVWLEVI